MIDIATTLLPLIESKSILLLMPGFDSATGIFSSIAWLSTGLALVFFLFAFFGANVLDIGADVGEGDLGYFSIQTILGFLMGLGWGGTMGMEFGASVLLSSIFGLILGGIMFFTVAKIINLLYKLEVDGNVTTESLVGLQGSVYVTIPPHGEQGGQVQLNHPNGLLTLNAVQEGDTPLSLQSPIVVIDSSPQRLLVKSL